jgi:hypothetical protein
VRYGIAPPFGLEPNNREKIALKINDQRSVLGTFSFRGHKKLHTVCECHAATDATLLRPGVIRHVALLAGFANELVGTNLPVIVTYRTSAARVLQKAITKLPML